MIVYKDRLKEAGAATQTKQKPSGYYFLQTKDGQIIKVNQDEATGKFTYKGKDGSIKTVPNNMVKQAVSPNSQNAQGATPQQTKEVQKLQPGDYYVNIDGENRKVNQYQNGTFGIENKDGTVNTVDKSQVKQVPVQGANASKTSSTANNQVLKYFKDGDMKTRLSLRNEPFSKITLSGGNIVIESKNQKTVSLLESLSINAPTYLYKMKEENYTAPLGTTNLNWMLSDQIQKALQAADKDIMSIDCSSGEPVFIDGEGNQIKIADIKQMLAGQSSTDAASAGEQKMSMKDLNQITTAVVNQLNAKLNSVKTDNGTYKVQWAIDKTGFDPSTLKESQLSEGILDAAKKVGNAIGTAFGTQASKERNMTNGSVASPFRVKAIVVDTKTGKEVKEESVYQQLYKTAAKIMPSVKLKSTDVNGNEYDTTALVKAQPYEQGGLFTYQAQMNVGYVDNSAAEQQQQQIQQDANQQIKNVKTLSKGQQRNINNIKYNANKQKNNVKKKKKTIFSNFKAPTAHMSNVTGGVEKF